MLNRWNKYNNGFSLLELMTVLAIISTASIVAIPYFQEWGAKRSFDKSVVELQSELSKARLEAFTRGKTMKVSTNADGDNYDIVVYYNDTATDNCGATSGWNQLSTKTVTLNYNFQITGSGVGNVCFFRDGTATGGTYLISQKDGETNLGNSTISIVVTTGFIDVTKN